MSTKDQATGSSMAEEGGTVGYLMSDLSQVTPAAFVLNLRQAYVDGKGKAGTKFQVLRQHVTTSLPTAPPPGPATFVVQCIEVLLAMDPPYNEGLSHLLTSAYRHLAAEAKPEADTALGRKLAAELVTNAVISNAVIESRVLVRIIVVFQVHLLDIGQILVKEECDDKRKIAEAKATVEPFILNLVKEKLYTSAVSLLKQFDLQDCTPQEFLVTMVNAGQAELAGQWAAHLGKEMLSFLVRQSTDMGYYKVAYKLVERYQLGKEFPDAYQLYRRSTIRKLVGKGLWDVAEAIATEAHLQEYLVNLATEEGHTSEVAGLCQRFRLEHVAAEAALTEDDRYLQLSSIVGLENIFFVDTVEGLASAAEHFRGVTVVGMDCEWKANREKGRTENKVSILQLATPEKVFVFDLIRLCGDEPVALDHCIKQVFHSPNVLKLGYAVSNDLKRLLQSYQNLSCFVRCESVLDLQTYAGAKRGGLSGLAKLALGSSLDKCSRMTDWEQRPLTVEQLHYAALDAAVLLSIFGYLSATPPGIAPNMNEAKDWKSMLISFRSTLKKSSNVEYCAENSLHMLITNMGSSQDNYPSCEGNADADDTMTRFVSGEQSSGSEEPAGPQVLRGSSSWRLPKQQHISTLHSDQDQRSRDLGDSGDSPPTTVFTDGGNEGESCTESGQSIVDCTTNKWGAGRSASSATESDVVSAVGSNNVLTSEIASLVHSRPESILTSFEDVPTPGLLRNELEERAHAAGLPSPHCQAISWGRRPFRLFCCVVSVGDVYIFGGVADRKKDAEFMAIQVALSYLASDRQNLQPLSLSGSPTFKLSGGFGIANTQVSMREVAESLRYCQHLQTVKSQLNSFSAFNQACLHQQVWMRDVTVKGKETLRRTSMASVALGSSQPVKISSKRDFQTDASFLWWVQQWGKSVVSAKRAAETRQKSLQRKSLVVSFAQASADMRSSLVVKGNHFVLKRHIAGNFRKAGMVADVTLMAVPPNLWPF